MLIEQLYQKPPWLGLPAPALGKAPVKPANEKISHWLSHTKRSKGRTDCLIWKHLDVNSQSDPQSLQMKHQSSAIPVETFQGRVNHGPCDAKDFTEKTGISSRMTPVSPDGGSPRAHTTPRIVGP